MESNMTYSLSPQFDVLTKATTTTEKCLTIDLQTVKSSYDLLDLKDVAYIRSE